MSRRSHAFAYGQPAFSWTLGKFTDEQGRERYKATCKSAPSVFGLGDTEQTAMLNARKAMEQAVDSDDMGLKGPGQLGE